MLKEFTETGILGIIVGLVMNNWIGHDILGMAILGFFLGIGLTALKGLLIVVFGDKLFK